MIVVADIGGTNSRFAVFKDGRLHGIRIYPSDEFQGFVPLVKRYMDEKGINAPVFLSIAIAGTVTGESASCVNLSWDVYLPDVREKLPVEAIFLMNDFEAAAWGVTHLKQKDLFQIGGPCKKDTSRPMAVIGAGTGLGEATVVPCPKVGYHVLPSEGGHGDFAPSTEEEWRLFCFLRERYGHVSIERIVSGPGIRDTYEFFSGKVGHPKEITKKAISKKDQWSQKTMTIFIQNYAKEAANLALKTLAMGGIYITGGIAPSIKTLFIEKGFRTAFETKGRMERVLKEIPTFIVEHPYLGLLGAGIRALKGPT